MNAETKTVEDALRGASSLMTIDQIREASGLEDSVVRAELRQLAKRGQVEHVPGRGRYDARYGLLAPVEKPAPTAASGDVILADEGKTGADSKVDIDRIFATAPELQYLAPEDYKLPPTDPVLLASANRMLSERLDGVAHALRGSGLPALAKVSGGEDLQPHVAALTGAYQMALAELANARALADKLEHLLGVERTASAALREQLDLAANTTGAASGRIDSYVVIAPKRPIRRFTGDASAVKSAMAAASNGSGRGEVFGLVHIGTAKRGAVWSSVK